MKYVFTTTAAVLLFLTGIDLFIRDSAAIDAPHNTAATNVGCTLCHIPVSASPEWANGPWSGDNTKLNLLCASCHDSPDSIIVDEQYNGIKTHSAANTGSSYGNGTWTVECVACHDPHYQRQPRISHANGYLEGGVTTSATTSVMLTDGTKAWTRGQWKNFFLIPNTTYPTLFYEVSDNTATAITVRAEQSGMYTRYTGDTGTSYGLKYGKLINDTVVTASARSVLFFAPTGTNSFADGTAAIDGICQVCHTQTKYFTADGSKLDQGHPAAAGTNCTESCHLHSSGFKANCAQCHGVPPAVASRNEGSITNGLVNNDGGTGSATPGAHGKHAVTLGYSCPTCHTSGMPASVIYDKTIQIGFTIANGAYQSGSYDGRSALANGFSYTAGNAGTSVTRDGSMTCIALYCHSDGTSVSTGVVPAISSPNWGAGATSCDSCHGYPPNYAGGSPKPNSHEKHNYSCDNCHYATTTNGTDVTNPAFHANTVYDLLPGPGRSFSYSFAKPNGTCSTVSCHGNTGTQWGAAACLDCHAVSQGDRAAIATQFGGNSHHVQGMSLSNIHCYQCHWEANSDGSIDPAFHGGSSSSGSPVDLVIYGNGARPATYTEGATAVRYTADGSRTEIQKINTHCLGCHSDQNNAAQPFGDGKTPKQYAWDGTSIGSKYLQTGTTSWGKYTTTAKAAKKNITKAYSAHGNAQNNYGGGWPDAPNECFGANITQTICTEFGGAWNGACINIAQGACEQNFCADFTAGTCGQFGGTWTGTVCTGIAENKCTGPSYCTLPVEVCDEFDPTYCWTEYYTDTNTTQPACQAAGGAWTVVNGTWKTAGKWSSGVDYELNPTRGGVNAKIVACFDCHNSHGSTVEGTTSSYTSETPNGGILKDTTTYKPSAGGSSAGKNAYNPGAGLCFDCHLNANAGSTPWGYADTFGASQKIMGYWDTESFGTGTFGSQQRFPYKAVIGNKGGHFGASASLASAPAGTVRGLCTPCHDPHGVTTNTSIIAAEDKAYAVPILKGTWLTSPYREDAAPSLDQTGTINDVNAGNVYHIDQNTAAADINQGAISMVTQTDGQFAGLCLQCHAKASLTNGADHTWKSKDRIHEAVKGWKTANGTIKHNYPCSKCHAPHNARLPRLMVTNCLDNKHKGRYDFNLNPVLSGSSGPNWYADDSKVGSGGAEYGGGKGAFPGSHGGGEGYDPNYSAYVSVTSCHENQAADQSWNVVTQWAQEIPVLNSGPAAGSFTAAGSNVQATITWQTNKSYSTSYVDYGLTSYGSTTGNSTLVLNHSVGLQNLINHSTYNYRVRSKSGAGNETASGNYLFYISLPPAVPMLIDEPTAICAGSCSVTLQWNAATDPDGGPVQYYVEVDDASDFSNPNYNSGWVSGTSHTLTVGNNTIWYWRVKARDGNHTGAGDSDSAWSASDTFTATDGDVPSQVTLIYPVSGAAVLSDSVLQWSSVPGAFVEYLAEYSTDATFNSGVASSGWTTNPYWYPYPGPAAYYWRVQARNSATQATGPWSATWSFSVSDGCYGDPCCLYGCSTCPTLYSWDGAAFAFETDTFPTGFLGTKTATGWRKPNPYEYHLLENTPQLLDGYYNLRIVEERDETDYFDTLKLYAVDYPLDRDIYQELRTAGTYAEPAQMIHTVDKTLKKPLSITHVNTGEEVSAKLAYSDGDYLILNTDRNIDFDWQTLEIDLGDQSSAPQIKLIIDAEMVVPTTSAGMARKTQLSPTGKITKLEVLDANGNWTQVPYTTKELFSPKERSNAYLVDITNIFTTPVYRFRLSFLYKVYVDAIFFDTTLDVPVTVAELPLTSATLGYYGFSEKTEGEIFDYIYGSLVSRDTSYFSGNYTKYGEVTSLLTQTDDKFVIFAGGEELDVRFSADSQPPVEKARRYLVYANGYYKATGNVDIPHTVEPLPFKAMTNYPYDPAVENYPSDEDHTRYRTEYNTRAF